MTKKVKENETLNEELENVLNEEFQEDKKEDNITNNMFEFDLEKIDGIDLYQFINSVKDIYADSNVIIDEKTKACTSIIIDDFSKSISSLTQTTFELCNDILEKRNYNQLYESDVEENKKVLKNLEFVLWLLITELWTQRDKYILENDFFQSRTGSYIKNIPWNKFVSNWDILTKCLERDRFVIVEYLKIELYKITNIFKDLKWFITSVYYILNEKRR